MSGLEYYISLGGNIARLKQRRSLYRALIVLGTVILIVGLAGRHRGLGWLAIAGAVACAMGITSHVMFSFRRQMGLIRKNRFPKRIGQEIGHLASLANKNICVVSGHLRDKVYTDTNVLEAFRQAQRKGVKIQMIYGRRSSLPAFRTEVEKWEKEQDLPYHNRIEFYEYSSWPKTHFMVIDYVHYRTEAPHDPYTEEHPALISQLDFVGACLLRWIFYRMTKQIRKEEVLSKSQVLPRPAPKELKVQICDYIRENPGADVMDVAHAFRIRLAEAAHICEQLMAEGKLKPLLVQAQNDR